MTDTPDPDTVENEESPELTVPVHVDTTELREALADAQDALEEFEDAMGRVSEATATVSIGKGQFPSRAGDEYERTTREYLNSREL